MANDRASRATFPMTPARGIVVAFRPRRPDAGGMPHRTPAVARDPAPCLVRLYEGRDVALNADWDRFMTLVAQAWSWRDPDCVAALEDCLAQLRRSVDHDWS